MMNIFKNIQLPPNDSIVSSFKNLKKSNKIIELANKFITNSQEKSNIFKSEGEILSQILLINQSKLSNFDILKEESQFEIRKKVNNLPNEKLNLRNYRFSFENIPKTKFKYDKIKPYMGKCLNKVYNDDDANLLLKICNSIENSKYKKFEGKYENQVNEFIKKSYKSEGKDGEKVEFDQNRSKIKLKKENTIETIIDNICFTENSQLKKSNFRNSNNTNNIVRVRKTSIGVESNYNKKRRYSEEQPHQFNFNLIKEKKNEKENENINSFNYLIKSTLFTKNILKENDHNHNKTKDIKENKEKIESNNQRKEQRENNEKQKSNFDLIHNNNVNNQKDTSRNNLELKKGALLKLSDKIINENKLLNLKMLNKDVNIDLNNIKKVINYINSESNKDGFIDKIDSNTLFILQNLNKVNYLYDKVVEFEDFNCRIYKDYTNKIKKSNMSFIKRDK